MSRQPAGDGSTQRPAREGRPPAPAPRADDGPVLPDRAAEDRPEAWGERPDPDAADDEHYLRERPPHW